MTDPELQAVLSENVELLRQVINTTIANSGVIREISEQSAVAAANNARTAEANAVLLRTNWFLLAALLITVIALAVISAVVVLR